MTVCLDEMGPEAAKSHAGQALVHEPNPAELDLGQQPTERAKQEID